MKFWKNAIGFTLIELMTAIGIASGLVLVITSAQKQAITSQGGLKQNAEINDLIQRVSAEMSKLEVCSRNFGNNAGFTNNISIAPTNVQVDKLYDTNGRVIVSRNAQLGDINDYIKIDDLRLNKSGTNRISLTVFFTPKTSLLQTNKANIADKFIVNLNVFANRVNSAVIDSCFSDTQTAIESAVANACKGYDVAYTAPSAAFPYGKCEHILEVQDSSGTAIAGITTGTTTSFQCPSGELLAVVDSSSTNQKKLLKCAKVQTNGACGNWQYMTGLDAAGAPVCKSVLDFYGLGTGIVSTKSAGTYYVVNLACPAGWVLQKINSAYNPVCVNPNINQNCPAGQFATGTDVNGNPICAYYSDMNACTGGMYMRAINSTGTVTCAYPTFGGSCGAGKVANGVDAAGNITCITMPN